MYPPDPATTHFLRGFFVLLPIFIVVGIAIVLVPTWRICLKAGFSPWLSLLMLVPLGNLILLYFLAFADWRVVPMDQLGWPPQYPPQYPPPYPPQYPPQNPPPGPPQQR